MEMKESKKAIVDFDFVIKTTPSEFIASFLRSINQKELNDFKEVKKDALTAQQLGNRLPENYLKELE